MKAKFKIGNINVAELGLDLSGVEFEVEYSLEESIGAYGLVKQAIKELPEILEDFANGAKKFMELDNEFDEILEEDIKAKKIKAITEVIEEIEESIERCNREGLEEEVAELTTKLNFLIFQRNRL